MNLLDAITRYNLAEETSFILGAISLLLAVAGIILTLLSPRKQQALKGPIITICAVISLGSILLMWNYYTVRMGDDFEVVSVPNVEGLPYGSAQTLLRFTGLIEKPISAEGGVVSADNTVLSQSPAGSTKVLADTEVILWVGLPGTIVPIQPDAPTQPSVMPSDERLSISIESIQEAESYHYDYPDPQNPDATILIDFGRCLFGTFSYSRALTPEELADWYHGGRIYDEYGNEVGAEGNNPSFWSVPEGNFAVELPSYLPAGTYTYELYQIIGGQMVSATSKFTVN